MTSRICTECGRPLSALARKDMSTCPECRGFTMSAHTSMIPASAPTTRTPALAPPGPTPRSEEAEAAEVADRIVTMADGHALTVPPAPLVARDEESVTVARIAAMANGGPLPSAPAGGDDAETRAFVERMRQYAEQGAA